MVELFWIIFKEPFRMVNDFMFGDNHHIVSESGWKILNNNKRSR